MGNADNIYVGPVKVEYSTNGSDYTDVGYTEDDIRIVPEAAQEAIESGQTVGVVKKFRPSIRQYVEFDMKEICSLGMLQSLLGLEQSPGSGMKWSPTVGSTLYCKFTRLNYTGAAKIYTTQVFEAEPNAMHISKTPTALSLRFEEYPTHDATTGDVTFGSWSAS